MNNEAGTGKRRGVKASDLEAYLRKNPIAADQQSLVEELQRSDERRKREMEQTLLAHVRADQERERRRLAAESATVETATRLAAVEQQLNEGTRMQRRALRCTRWGGFVGTVAAVAAVVAAVVAVT